IEERLRSDPEYEQAFQAERLEELERMVYEVNPDHFAPVKELEKIRTDLEELRKHLGGKNGDG
ncbi:MAG TPA: hypothetical protein VF855_01175, partial [Acidimicrobiales bacterium]